MALTLFADCLKVLAGSVAILALLAGSAVAFTSYALEHLSDGLVRATLDNGLVVLVEENHTNPVASIRVFVNVGSIYEEGKLGCGLSHFLEHMMNEGTASMTKEDIELQVDRMGGTSNAATWRDYTTYYLNLPAKNIYSAIPFFAECLFEATFPREAFDSQQGIILREIEKGDDEHSRILQKLYYYQAYRESPIRYPTIGFTDQFLTLTLEDIEDYYRAHYVPGNMVLAVVGDFDAQLVLSAIDESFGKYPRIPYSPPVLAPEPPQEGLKVVMKPSSFRKAYFRFGYRTVTADDPDRVVLSVISAILSDGRSSRLIRHIKQDLALVDSISSWAVAMDYVAGSLGISATCSVEDLEEAVSAVRKEVEDFYSTKISDDELSRAKTQIIATEKRGEETVEARARTLALYQLYHGNPLYADVFINRVKAVTKEDVRRVAEKYLREENLTIVELIPEEHMPKFPEVSEQAPEKPRMFTLDNGIRVIVKENHTAPTVVVGVFVLGGLGEEDVETAGISDLTMRMLVGGAGGKSSGWIARQVEKLGGSFTAGAGTGASYIKLTILSENLKEGVSVLAKCVTDPDFPPKYFYKERDRAKNRILRIADSWGSEASRQLRENLYIPTHPYSYPFEGKEEITSRITVEQVRELYQKRFHPQNMVITVVGDVSTDEARKMMDEYFGKMKAPKNVEAETMPEPSTDIYAPPVNVENTWGMKIALVYWGFPTVPYKHPDYFPLLVIDAGLSGMYYPGGPLHYRLRKAGMVYAVHAYHSNLPQGGYFAVYLATTAEQVEDAVAMVEEELEKLCTVKWSDEDLSLAKEVALGGISVYYHQSNADLSAVMAMDELMGVGYDFVQSYEERIMAVSAEEVLECARKYLALDRAIRVVIMPGE